MGRELLSQNKKVDPRVKDVLKLLGLGVVLAALIIAPGTSILLKEYLQEKAKRDKKEWEKFNLWRLKQVLKRLEKQKLVEVSEGRVKITEKGRRKILRYNLQEMNLKRKTDGKWRIVIYDVAHFKKSQRDLFRETLLRLKFLPIQKSVYLTPFICDEEIEFLRQTFNIGKEVVILKVSSIENAEVYKKYFGIS